MPASHWSKNGSRKQEKSAAGLRSLTNRQEMLNLLVNRVRMCLMDPTRTATGEVLTHFFFSHLCCNKVEDSDVNAVALLIATSASENPI
jgi:hypothetical protein